MSRVKHLFTVVLVAFMLRLLMPVVCLPMCVRIYDEVSASTHRTVTLD